MDNYHIFFSSTGYKFPDPSTLVAVFKMVWSIQNREVHHSYWSISDPSDTWWSLYNIGFCSIIKYKSPNPFYYHMCYHKWLHFLYLICADGSLDWNTGHNIYCQPLLIKLYAFFLSVEIILNQNYHSPYFISFQVLGNSWFRMLCMFCVYMCACVFLCVYLCVVLQNGVMTENLFSEIKHIWFKFWLYFLLALIFGK